MGHAEKVTVPRVDRPDEHSDGPGAEPPKESGGRSYWDAPSPAGDSPAWEPPAGSSETPLWETPAGGPQAPASAGYRAPGQQQTPGNAIAALVLGILGLILCPIVCSVLAIVFGQQAKSQIERDPNLTGAGLAQAGFIMGIVGLVLYGLFILIWVIAIAAMP